MKSQSQGKEMKMQTKPSVLIGLYLVLSFIAHIEKSQEPRPESNLSFLL